MKKIILLLVGLVATFCVASAQNYDEVQLLGKWNVVSLDGSPNDLVVKFSSISFGDCIMHDEDNYGDLVASGIMYGVFCTDPYFEDDSMQPIWDFWISNGNKLHIMFKDSFDSPSFRFVIDELNDDKMVLHTFDNKCQLMLSRVKDGDLTSVSSVVNDNMDQMDAIYTIGGVKVETPKSGINIVRKNGVTTKLIVF